jgi:hypothetical protein
MISLMADWVESMVESVCEQSKDEEVGDDGGEGKEVSVGEADMSSSSSCRQWTGAEKVKFSNIKTLVMVPSSDNQMSTMGIGRVLREDRGLGRSIRPSTKPNTRKHDRGRQEAGDGYA